MRIVNALLSLLPTSAIRAVFNQIKSVKKVEKSAKKVQIVDFTAAFCYNEVTISKMHTEKNHG